MNAQHRQAKNGRRAILARIDENSPWVQVESVLGDENAQRMVDDLENDEQRKSFIEDADGDDWGDDAPRDLPTA